MPWFVLAREKLTSTPGKVLSALLIAAAVVGVVVFATFFRDDEPPDLRLAPTTTAASDTGRTVLEVPSAPDTTVPRAEDEEPEIVIAENALYVDGTNGSGSNPGTVDAPFKRPIEAFSVVEPGMTIYLREGVYEDGIHGANVMRRSGTPDEWISIEAYPEESVEIIAGGEWGNGFEFRGAAFIRLSGFVITGREDSIHGSGVFGKEDSHDIVVSRNYIEGFGGAGVSFIHSSRITVEHNEIRENAFGSFYQGSGISLFEARGPLEDGDDYANVITGNYVVGNYNAVLSRQGKLTDGNCIIIDFFNNVGYEGSTLVENNVCVENGGRGVHVFNSSNVTARHNTLVGNNRSVGLVGGGAEMVAARGTNIVFYNNLVLNSSGIPSHSRSDADDAVFENNYVASDVPDGPGNKELPAGSSVVVSRSGSAEMEDFRPLVNSPIVGTAKTDQQPDVDALGMDRPARGSIGALEPFNVSAADDAVTVDVGQDSG